MTHDEELLQLRAYKAKHDACACDRAFTRLQELLDLVHFDPLCSPRAFRVIAECLLTLKDKVDKHD